MAVVISLHVLPHKQQTSSRGNGRPSTSLNGRPGLRYLGAAPQELQRSGFRAYAVDTDGTAGVAYRRRNFYNVALMTSDCTVHYAYRSLRLPGPSLLVANHHIPYSLELHAPRPTGYPYLFSTEP